MLMKTPKIDFNAYACVYDDKFHGTLAARLALAMVPLHKLTPQPDFAADNSLQSHAELLKSHLGAKSLELSSAPFPDSGISPNDVFKAAFAE